MIKTIAIIGSTGSIGSTTLKIIKKYKKKFKIILLFANKSYKKLNFQNKIFKPKYVSLNNKEYFCKLKPKKNKLKSIDDFFKKNKKKIDYVVSAVSGYSALEINFKLLKITKNLLIANKETVICGGKIFLEKAKKYNCNIVPIDSEHYSINFFLKSFKEKNFINKFYLTASGGPFFKKKIKKNTLLKEVTNHPTWKMGKKISVNSANLTNKIMELFEAHILFGIPVKKLAIKIEKSSKVHSIISLNNSLDLFILHDTSMEIPIENSLINKNYLKKNKKNLMSLNNLNLEIENPSYEKFPIIKTGFKVLNLGNRAMILFTIINDRLVEMYFRNEKKFEDIVKCLLEKFSDLEIVKYSKRSIRSLVDIKDTIKFAKKIKL